MECRDHEYGEDEQHRDVQRPSIVLEQRKLRRRTGRVLKSVPRRPAAVRSIADRAQLGAAFSALVIPIAAHGHLSKVAASRRTTGPEPPVKLGATPASPGVHRVAVQVAVGSTTRAGSRALKVRRGHAADPIPARHAARAATHDVSRPRRPISARDAARAATHDLPRPRRPDPAPAGRPGTAARAQPHGAVRHALVARVAGDPGVTIADFNFTPGTITVHTGDTITWTNNGPSSHTASARDGSFDTGVLQRGASSSHTFTQAGSFSYYCKIHPLMHGTIVVLAAATPSPASPSSTAAKSRKPTPGPKGASTQSSGASAPSPGAKPQASDTQTLPMTGVNVITGLAAGLLLLALGLALRRAPFR